jgi:hypothetical protein
MVGEHFVTFGIFKDRVVINCPNGTYGIYKESDVMLCTTRGKPLNKRFSSVLVKTTPKLALRCFGMDFNEECDHYMFAVLCIREGAEYERELGC